jgi:PKD repeat protein
VWVDFNPADKSSRLVTNEYDATSPSFGAVSVPATADTGASVAMSASASDDWSPPTVGWDFGDGQTATGKAVSHTYAKRGTYTVTATATDGGGNTAVVTRDVTVSGVAPLAKPKIGKTFNAASVHGTILVSTPKSGTGKAALRGLPPVRAAISPPHGYTKFRRLGGRAHIPIGSILQASLGTVSITMSANKTGTKLQTGQFSQGLFLVKQTTHSPLTSAEMMGGGNFKRDCRRPRGKAAVGTARRRPHRRLFANVHGRFRTRGRHSTATVRGTKYLVKESCKGTLTIVSRGSVVVRDFRKHRTVVVRAGHRYLAAQ